MKNFLAVIEDAAGNVTGAAVIENGFEITVTLAPDEIVPRSQLRNVAVTLATKYGVNPASFTVPAESPNTPPPPPE